jgi:hypothetical protein
MADPILTDYEIKTLETQPSLAVRVRVPMDQLDLATLFAVHLPRLHAAAGGARVSPHPPDPVSGADPIELSELPGGPTAVAIHHGSYETLGAAYDRLHDWIHSQGREDGPGPWESYIDLPGEAEDMASLRTVLHWPLQEG